MIDDAAKPYVQPLGAIGQAVIVAKLAARPRGHEKLSKAIAKAASKAMAARKSAQRPVVG